MKNISPKEFYDEISPFYDHMTSFKNRVEKEKETFQKWLQHLSFHSVLDVGCGSGIHSIAMSLLEKKVIGMDLSYSLLEKAWHNSMEYQFQIPFIQGSMTQIPFTSSAQFDCILCLGNTLPHLLDKKDVSLFFQQSLAILAPKGFLALQLLNYEKILSEKERIINIRRINDCTIIRFYDFWEDNLGFNILKIEENNQYQLYSTVLYPYTSEEIIKLLSEAGFSHYSIYGDMQWNEFDPAVSKNVVILAFS